MVNTANEGLDDPSNVSLLHYKAKLAIGISNNFWPFVKYRGVPDDTGKLVRSIDQFEEKLTEYHANFDESNERKIIRGLQHLLNEFVDVQGEVEDYCGPYLRK